MANRCAWANNQETECRHEITIKIVDRFTQCSVSAQVKHRLHTFQMIQYANIEILFGTSSLLYVTFLIQPPFTSTIIMNVETPAEEFPPDR